MISKGNHVKFGRFVLAVSEEAKTLTSRFASLTEQDKDSQNTKGRRRWQRGCLLIT